ncbi:hypothetical protein MSG28_010785 [Choristoneura fumiferana]|uniref:Uncharacterized protein n=1 Tax=Choristoneura fumiferana TaxID=7141 RepID=A0ACC0KNW9_CHOFU|nr:hypothetical protein MSG28_010785 [Choristoneura fumiferana]
MEPASRDGIPRAVQLRDLSLSISQRAGNAPVIPLVLPVPMSGDDCFPPGDPNTFQIYHELCGEGKHREETCTNLRSNSMVCVKFPIRTGPAWELWPKPSCSERRPVPSSGTYIGWDDDDEICKRKATTPCHNHVKSILYKNNVLTNDMAYGQYNESVARTLFIEKLQKAVRPAGLFIDEEFGFLGASPDDPGPTAGSIMVECGSRAVSRPPTRRSDDLVQIAGSRWIRKAQDKTGLSGEPWERPSPAVDVFRLT